jgi:hypothetical protein
MKTIVAAVTGIFLGAGTYAGADVGVALSEEKPPATIAYPIFETPRAALALARKLGPAWQGNAREVDERMGSLVMKRYYFSSDEQFLRVSLTPNGNVSEFYLYAGQPRRDVQDNRCALLPAPTETARILLAVVEPRHDLADESTVASAATLGWKPLFQIQGARVFRTRIRFTSSPTSCRISMRRDR